MNKTPYPRLTVHTGDRKELERQMIRAHLERRYGDSRAVARTIARRATLTAVDWPESQDPIAACDRADR